LPFSRRPRLIIGFCQLNPPNGVIKVTRRIGALAGAAAMLVCDVIYGQPQPAHPLYEAASIKINNSASGHSGTDGSPGQIMFTNLPLKRLIERAYDVGPAQVVGPEWMETVRFDIVAKFPAGSTAADRPLMLRSLLEERLKLAAHHETRELPGFALVVANGGFKLKPAEAGGRATDS
jgi:uncharacterized protein (TIGR03435 family)